MDLIESPRKKYLWSDRDASRGRWVRIPSHPSPPDSRCDERKDRYECHAALINRCALVVRARTAQHTVPPSCPGCSHGKRQSEQFIHRLPPPQLQSTRTVTSLNLPQVSGATPTIASVCDPQAQSRRSGTCCDRSFRRQGRTRGLHRGVGRRDDRWRRQAIAFRDSDLMLDLTRDLKDTLDIRGHRPAPSGATRTRARTRPKTRSAVPVRCLGIRTGRHGEEVQTVAAAPQVEG